MEKQETAVLVHPVLKDGSACRPSAESADEARGLALAIGINVVFSTVCTITRPRPSTFIGDGKVRDIGTFLDTHTPRPVLVIVDRELTAVQHRNLEKAWKAKVLDRTALILEIFGARARTAEGRLQVELACLDYQRSRLVRSWTHLERQRGGAGFMGGPGEKQIESDRRYLDRKMARVRKKLDNVIRTRDLHRKNRQQVPYPLVAFVGYTNAGKSTLFNRLTGARVEAADRLFSTLDPTMRSIVLPSGNRIILSDTVGFISGLPTQLVAAFRATLEEVLVADILVHVRDFSRPDTRERRDDVISVLSEIGAGKDGIQPVVEVLNKTDLPDPYAQTDTGSYPSGKTENRQGYHTGDGHIPLSAKTGEGIRTLLEKLDSILSDTHTVCRISIPGTCGEARAFLHEHGHVLEETARGDRLVITVRLPEKVQGQYLKRYPFSRRESGKNP